MPVLEDIPLCQLYMKDNKIIKLVYIYRGKDKEDFKTKTSNVLRREVGEYASGHENGRVVHSLVE